MPDPPTRTPLPATGARLAAMAESLYGFAMARTRNRTELAMDMVQEVLGAAMAASRDGRQWPDDEALWAWLVAVLRNKLVDDYRRRQHRAPTLGSLGVDLAVLERTMAASDALPHELAGADETAVLCRAAVSALPPAHQRVLDGFYRRGASHRELADEAGTSDKAIESLLARARAGLRAELQRRLDNPEDLL